MIQTTVRLNPFAPHCRSPARPPDLKAKLANSTEAELKSLQSSLHSLKDDTAVELQRNVFKKSVQPIPRPPTLTTQMT